MDDFGVRVLAVVAGFLAGLVVGWTSRSARDLRDVRRAVMPNEAVPRRLRISRSDVVLGVLVAVTLAATVSSVHTDQRVDRISECNQRVTAGLVRAANERTNYADESSQRNVDLQRAARDVVSATLNPQGTDADRRERMRSALQGYGEALDAFERVQAKAKANRHAYPYPSSADIARCR
jgi:hypothetical protein